MIATNIGYAGVRKTSGTNGVASGKRVNFPVAASTWPSRRYPSWSVQKVVQSRLWYQMKNRPWSVATRHTIHNARRTGIGEILAQQFAIQLIDIVHQSIESVARRDQLPAGLAHAAAALGVREQGVH